MSSQVNIQGLITSLASGTQKIGPVVLANTVNIGSVYDVPMNASTATITLPSAAANGLTPEYMLIIPPASSTAPITFKLSTNSGDTGLPIGSSTASMISFAATAPTTVTFTFGATSAATMEVKVW